MGKYVDYYVLIYPRDVRNRKQSSLSKALDNIAQVVVETQQKDRCHITAESLLESVDLSSLNDNEKQIVAEIAQIITRPGGTDEPESQPSETDELYRPSLVYYYHRNYSFCNQKEKDD